MHALVLVGINLDFIGRLKQILMWKAIAKKFLIGHTGGALAKFRSGTAPIAIETGRYNGVNINDRKCFACRDVVEDETHVLLHCPEYNTLRDELLNEAEKY